MSHPALTQLRALRYCKEIPALEPQLLDWLLLEDSMTKRFEQQGKTVSVTMIREGFVEQNEIPKNCRCCRKSLVTGYVKFCYVPMVNRGLPVVPSFLCQR